MGGHRVWVFLISTSCLSFLSALVTPGASRTNQAANNNGAQTKQSLSSYRENPQKCDLVCPGEPPLPLPPNFLKNCTTPSNNNTSQNVQTTTPKPSGAVSTSTISTTTEEEGEEGGEEENTEETTTKKGGKRMMKLKNRNGNHDIKKHQRKTDTHNKIKQNRNNKHYLRKEKVMLKHKMTSKLLKHKQFKQSRTRLDGCYVVCSDENGQTGQPGSPAGSQGANPGNQGETPETDEPGSDESVEDSYIPGEDTPIEIYYISRLTHNNQRPVDLYNTNNVASANGILAPGPDYGIGVGYEDPMFFEEKKKEAKRKSHKEIHKKKQNHKENSS